MKDVSPESKYEEYVLSRCEINGIPVYVGFRFSTGQLYYKVPLLNGRPEAIVYVKDEETDASKGVPERSA